MWPPNQQMCMHHELSYKLEQLADCSPTIEVAGR